MCDLIATDGPGGPIVASNGQYFGTEAGLQTLLQPLRNAATPQTMTIRARSFINAAPERSCPRRRQHPHGRLRRCDQSRAEERHGIRAPRPVLLRAIRCRVLD